MNTMNTSKTTFGKYFILSFLAIGLALSSCKKEEPKEPTPDPEPTYSHVKTQVPIVYKQTGETCYYCGQWGWQGWIDISDDVKGKAFCWGNYGSGYSNGHFRGQELTSTDGGTSVMQNIQNNFGTSGKPSFYINGSKEALTGANLAEAITNVKAAIHTKAGMTDVDASVAMLPVTWDGMTATVKAETKLHKNLNGTYFMGAYIVENKAKGTQSGHPNGTNPNLEHHLVMRGSMSSSTWGEQIFNGAKNSGEKFEKTYEVTIPSSYKKENISVGVVLWKKNGGKYVYVNAQTNQ